MRPKTISHDRDLLQSRALVWSAVPPFAFILCLAALYAPAFRPAYLVEVLVISLTFALVAWRLRAATPLAAVVGGILCLVITLFTSQRASPDPGHTGLTPLVLLFLLTFAATRLGRQRKARAGLAESRRGRNSAQVLANLGVAALWSSVWYAALRSGLHRQPNASGIVYSSVPMLAALAEATADTVSSEIGQAFGGTPHMILTLRRVPPGTDGAITLTGTAAGIAAAALISASAMPALGLTLPQAALVLVAGTAGLFFDSLLGATVERKGWIGNDLVNLISTLFAATTASLLAHTS